MIERTIAWYRAFYERGRVDLARAARRLSSGTRPDHGVRPDQRSPARSRSGMTCRADDARPVQAPILRARVRGRRAQHALGPGQPFGDARPRVDPRHAFPAAAAAEAKLVSCPVGRGVRRRRRPAARLGHLPQMGGGRDRRNDQFLSSREGCAHGFQALTDEVHLIYQHSAYYAPEAEGGVRFDDPAHRHRLAAADRRPFRTATGRSR